MGTTTNAMLMYGYNIGSEDDDTLPDWWAAADEDDEDDDFATAATDRLIAAAGFTEPQPNYDDDRDAYRAWYHRKSEAEKNLGVKVASHCSADYPMYVLTAKTITAHRGDVKTIDDLEPPAGADDRLAWASGVLGLDVNGPVWLLASFWG